MLENYEQKLKSGYYYVRTSWEDTDTQIGQYRLLTSAVKKADDNTGYSVFTPEGVAIYPENTDTQAVVASEVASKEEAQVNTQAEDENAAEGIVRITAQDEMTTEGEYPNNGNTEPVLYARANTLLNIRAGNSLDAEKIGEVRKGTIVEVLEVCDNGWYRIKNDAAQAYVSNANGKYFNTGTSLYTVQPADSLWKIAEKTLSDGKRYTEIRTLNNLTSNVIRVGMVLLIP